MVFESSDLSGVGFALVTKYHSTKVFCFVRVGPESALGLVKHDPLRACPQYTSITKLESPTFHSPPDHTPCTSQSHQQNGFNYFNHSTGLPS
jgi:hypothetical protein